MRRTGYTLADLLVVVIVLAIVGALLLPLVRPARPIGSRQFKDSTQVRGIHQGMILFAQSNQDRFPLPSQLDAAGHTLPGDAAAKDTTANIISMLIYQGFFSPELTVSPSESNPKIRVFGKYQYGDPSGTVKPRQALWDPAFAADFTAGEANLSYAMTPMWSKERVETVTGFNSLQAVLGSRGPQIAGVTYNRAGEATPRRMNAGSHTDLIHGGRDTWEGNISYGDNSVNFETVMMPERLKWKDRAGSAFGDVLFYDEPGDTTDTNAFLGIFVNTGATKDQWRAIWD
jgi:type II secretory pathway pseudopilin PulG